MNRIQSPLIISHPERQSGTQHALFSMLTVGIWVLWIYLWLPLITGILWIVGIRWAYIQVFRGARGVSFWVIAWILGAVIVAVAYWSIYNTLLYAERTQRRHAKVLSKIMIGQKFGVTGDALYTLVHERRLILYFNDREELMRVEPSASMTAQAFPATKPVGIR
jgi:biofilm PGA synthesis protein PgaD